MPHFRDKYLLSGIRSRESKLGPGGIAVSWLPHRENQGDRVAHGGGWGEGSWWVGAPEGHLWGGCERSNPLPHGRVYTASSHVCEAGSHRGANFVLCVGWGVEGRWVASGCGDVEGGCSDLLRSHGKPGGRGNPGRWSWSLGATGKGKQRSRKLGGEDARGVAAGRAGSRPPSWLWVQSGPSSPGPTLPPTPSRMRRGRDRVWLACGRVTQDGGGCPKRSQDRELHGAEERACPPPRVHLEGKDLPEPSGPP